MAEYSKRHGGPWDRGSSDSYYRRWFEPHYYEQGTGTSKRVPITDKDSEDYKAYEAGWRYNEMCGDYKNWGDE